MLTLVKLMGIVIVVAGIIFGLNPKAMKAYIAFWGPGKRLRIGAVLSFVIGFIFLLAAAQCRLTAVINIFGILAVIKGILLFILGPEKIKSMMNWWQQKSDLFIRLYALFALAMGALLIYSA